MSEATKGLAVGASDSSTHNVSPSPSPSSSSPSSRPSSLHGSNKKQASPAPMVRSRALASGAGSPAASASAASISSAAAFDLVEAQFVRFISNREQLIAQWTMLDASSYGVVSFAAFRFWLSEQFPMLSDASALKLAFERVYTQASCESVQLLFKDFGAILVNLLFFSRACSAYKDCGVSADQGMDLRDFKRILATLNMEMAHADALSQFRSVDINDSGDISFSEFCVWLIHQLGPRLMQKISDSVQSSAQAIVSSPEASKGANTWKAVHSASPSMLQAQDKSPSLSTPPPHSAAVVNAAAGNETSPSSSYFALQIGINYVGSAAPLAGCVSDIRGWAELFRSFGCSFNMHIVCSDENSRIAVTERQRGAKKSDILGALQDIRGAMMASEASHKFLFLNFSGHGVQDADRDGDEEDGYDECLAPADYDVAGYISDDLLSRWLRDLPEHTCFAVFDCCHSGTCLDLKDVPSFRGFFVSGCSDNQESADVEAADASANGALSSIVQSILRSKPSISFEHLRQQTLQGLQHGGFKQTPILECTLSHRTPLLSGWIKDSALEGAARDKAAESSQGQGKAAPGRSMYPNCSVCSQPPTSISSLSSGTCVSCHLYLCPVHVSLHRKQKATANHSIFSFAEVQDEALIRSRALPGSAAPVAATCSVHGATLELYCLAPTCQRTICTQCAVTAHKEHDWKPVEEVVEERRTTVGSAISLSGCAVEVISQAARTLDSVHDSVELQCDRARAAVEASAAAAAAVFNASLQRQRAAALKVIDEYQDSQVGQIAELHVALQEHSSAIESLAADTNNALQADPETAIKSSLFIPALTAASFEAQACAKAAFSIHQAHNETTICFTPRTTQVPDDAVMLGDTVFVRQGRVDDTRSQADSPVKLQNASGKGPSLGAAAGSSSVQSGDVSEKALNDGQGAAQPSPVQVDVDLNSWSAMSSQKRSKAIETLLRRQLGEWTPPPIAKKAGGSSSVKLGRPTTMEVARTIGSSSKGRIAGGGGTTASPM